MSSVVERLKPLHMADEPIAQAVVSSDQAERLRAVEAYIRANNALKSDAATLISSLVAENEELRGQTYLASAEAAEHHRDNAITMWHDEKTKRETAERLLAEARGVLRNTTCPRPANHRPDEFTAGECFDCGECGCHVAPVLSTGGVNG